MPRFSNFLKNLVIHFRMLLDLVTCFLRVAVSLQCRLQAVSNIHVPIYQRHEIVQHCDRHSNETVTLKKHVTKYKNMHKWMIEFLSKFEKRGIKIVLVNLILITKSLNL